MTTIYFTGGKTTKNVSLARIRTIIISRSLSPLGIIIGVDTHALLQVYFRFKFYTVKNCSTVNKEV